METYLLGLDHGNTVSKAALFDLRGKELEVASRKVDTIFSQPGWAERNMDSVWKSTASAIREVISKTSIDPKKIAGIGTSGHGNGLYLLDKNQQPFRNAIQSLDSRTHDLVHQYQTKELYDPIFSYALQAVWPSQTAMLLVWLKQYEPENYARIGSVLFCKDYLNYQLTGKIASDYTDMSGAGLMDVPQKRYSHELLELYGIPEIFNALPPLADSAEVIGGIHRSASQITGLAENTPVVGGLFDVDAGAIGAGAVQSGKASIIAGTWSINQVVTNKPIIDPNLFMSTIFAVPHHWLTIESSATSATNLEWFITQFCAEERLEAKKRDISVYEVCNEAVSKIPVQQANIIYHPFLYGSNTQGHARAGFYGVAGWHTRAHLLKSLYEGVVFSHLTHVEKLRKAGALFDLVRLTGGGSKSDVWAQMFADILNSCVEIPKGNEIGAKGAAIAAGIGAGLFQDYENAVQQMVTLERTHKPNPRNISVYHNKYQEYQSLICAMKEPWKKLSKP